MSNTSALADLYSLDILDSDSEAAFETIVQLASLICVTEQAYINFIDKNRQWTKAVYGAAKPDRNLQDSFCVHTVRSGEPLFIVDQPQTDSRFKDKVLVKMENGIRYYAGVPLLSQGGNTIGALCVVRAKHHQLNDVQVEALKLLGKQVNALLNERAMVTNLEEEKKQAESKAELQGLLTSLIAHELKNPLNTMLMLLDVLLTDGVDPDKFKHMAECTRIQLKDLATGIDDILNLGKRMIGTGEVQKEFGYIDQSIQSLIDLNASQLASKRNKVKVESCVEEEIYTDISGMMLIVGNLLSNANKFTEQGNITIRVAKEGKGICIEVEDTGNGMDEKTMKAINTGEFIHPGRGTNREKGLGVGLLFARQYLQMKGGHLTVQSEPGKGTKFSLLINDVKFVKPEPAAA